MSIPSRYSCLEDEFRENEASTSGRGDAHRKRTSRIAQFGIRIFMRLAFYGQTRRGRERERAKIDSWLKGSIYGATRVSHSAASRKFRVYDRRLTGRALPFVVRRKERAERSLRVKTEQSFNGKRIRELSAPHGPFCAVAHARRVRLR